MTPVHTATSTASCTAGKKVLGGGHTVRGYVVNSFIISIIANSATTDDTWTVTVGEYFGSGGLTITARAICM